MDDAHSGGICDGAAAGVCGAVAGVCGAVAGVCVGDATGGAGAAVSCSMSRVFSSRRLLKQFTCVLLFLAKQS